MPFKHIMCFLKSVVILTGAIFINASACEIPETEIPNLYNKFKGSLHLCPANGALILKSGVLGHVRFEGPYGSLNDQYLCHYSITHPQMGLPSTSDKDAPQDHTSSLIQQTHPSPAGVRLVLPGAHYDFFTVLTNEQIGGLLTVYTQLKMRRTTPEEALSKFFNFFNQLKSNFGKRPSDCKQKIFKQWPKGTLKNVEDLYNRYAQMFAGALAEQAYYPDNLVESALLALAWEKSEKLEDLFPLLTMLGEDITYFLNRGNNPDQTLSKETYQEWKKSNLVDKKLPPAAFIQLLKDPEKLIFFTLAYDQYDWPYPKMLDAMKTSYTYLDEQGVLKTISDYGDCGEAFTRNLLNLAIANMKTRTFDTSLLRKAFPNASPKLFRCFDGVPDNPQAYKQQSYDAVNGGAEGGAVWGNALSDLNQFIPNHAAPDINVVYGKDERCAIEPGFNNMLAVFEKILNDSGLSAIRREEGIEDIRRAKMLSYILQKFSRDDEFELSWHVNGQQGVLGNTQSFILTINGHDSFNGYVSQGHFDFLPILENKSEDWRRNPELLKNLIIDETVDPTLKRQLIPFYLGSTSYLSSANAQAISHAVSNETIKEHAKKYANEIFYGSNMSNTEEKFQAFDLGLMLDAPGALHLLPQWLNSYSPDAKIDYMTASLLYKHRQKCEQTPQILDKLSERIKSLHAQTLDQLHSDQPSMNLSHYLPYPYADALIIGFLEKKTPEEIGTLRLTSPFEESEEEYDLLYSSVGLGHIPLTHYLLERAWRELLSDANVNEHNPLTLAAALGYTEIARMLLAAKNEEEALPLLLSKSSYIKGGDQTSPLYAAADSGHTEIVQLLLAVKDNVDPLPLLLTDTYIIELRGTSQMKDTPLHAAAKKGCSGVVKALVATPAYLEQFLKYWENDWKETPISGARNYPEIQKIIANALEMYGLKEPQL